MPASRSRVRQVWRSWWQVRRWMPARALAPRTISFRPSADSACPRRGRFEYHEHLLSGGCGRTLVGAVGGKRGAEPRAHRHDALVAALALGDEPATLARVHATKPKT